MSQEYSLTLTAGALVFHSFPGPRRERRKGVNYTPWRGGTGPMSWAFTAISLINPHSHFQLGMNEPIFQAGTWRSEEMTGLLVWEGVVS